MTHPTLKNWTIWEGKIMGRVYGHDKFKNGETIVTTPIRTISFETHTVETMTGSIYSLYKDESFIEEDTTKDCII